MLGLLSHWAQNKMADILQTTFSNIFFKWKCVCCASNVIEIYSLGLYCQYAIMHGCWPGDKPIPETVVIRFTDAYMRQEAPIHIYIYTYGNIYKSIYVMWIRVKHQIFPRATVKWSKKCSLNNFRKSKTIYEAMYKISSVNLPLLIWFSVGQIWSSRDKMMVKRVITHNKVDIIALWPISPTLCAAKSLDSLHRGYLTQWSQRDAA